MFGLAALGHSIQVNSSFQWLAIVRLKVSAASVAPVAKLYDSDKGFFSDYTVQIYDFERNYLSSGVPFP